MNTSPLRIVFAGTPQFGLPALEALLSSPHPVVAVYTQPDRPSGRGQHLQPSAVKSAALLHQIPVYQPSNFRTPEAVAALAALKPDLMVVIAYGLILPLSVLSIPRLGCINVHASLLPAWRGASPIQSAILHGDEKTGVSIMQLDEGMDTGPVFTTVSTPILPTDTAGSLHDKLSELAIAPLLSVIDGLCRGTAHATAQGTHAVSHAKKILKEEACIDWTRSAKEIDQAIRAYFPWPVAYTTAQGTRLRIIEANWANTTPNGEPGEITRIEREEVWVATGSGELRIKQFQFPGGKVLPVSAWWHARSPLLTLGQRLGS